MNTTPPHPSDHLSEEDERLGLTTLLPPPPVPGLDPDRELLLRRTLLADTAPADPSGRRTARATRPRHRLVRLAVPAVACALAVGGVLVVGLPESPAPPPPQFRVVAPPTPPKRRGSWTASRSPPPSRSSRRSAPTSSCTSRARSPTRHRAQAEAP